MYKLDIHFLYDLTCLAVCYRKCRSVLLLLLLRISNVELSIFVKMGQLGLFFIYFRSFQTDNTIFTTNLCEKMSNCPSSIWRRDWNPRPFEQESSPITTRSGLLPIFELSSYLFHFWNKDFLFGCYNPFPINPNLIGASQNRKKPINFIFCSATKYQLV